MLPKNRASASPKLQFARIYFPLAFVAFMTARTMKGSSSSLLYDVHTLSWDDRHPQAGPIQDSNDACEALSRHEGGRWEHTYAPLSLKNITKPNATSILDNDGTLLSVEETYLPREIEWLGGNNWPNSWGACAPEAPLSYRSHLGNQCGSCGVAGFRPSHSTWLTPEGAGRRERRTNKDDTLSASPSLRLIRRLAERNQTLCIAGDSVDYQVYEALRHNLHRQQVLNRKNVTVSVSERLLPVEFAAMGLPSYEKYWMTIDQVRETTATLEYGDDGAAAGDGGRRVHRALFRYLKTYAWSPWNTLLMEDCGVLTLNLGLHYHGMVEKFYGGNEFRDDFRAAVTYLVDFVASREGRVAIWRSTLPQHFNTSNGQFVSTSTGCSLKPLKSPNDTAGAAIQDYNKAANEGFSALCRPTQQPQPNSCSRSGREHVCTVNRTRTDCRTVYKMLVKDNCTSGACAEHLERLVGAGDATVTGSIHRWNIADLFDVGQWHFNNNDCSHFCYVPVLYEAAFERLELLLASLH